MSSRQSRQNRPVAQFDALWNYDDPAGTEAAFRKVLEEEAPGWAVADQAELLTQIARALGLQKRFEEADEVLDQAEALGKGHSLAESRVLLERGRVRNSSGDKAGAIPLFEKALVKANEANEDFFAVDALHMLAIASPSEKQMYWHKEAIARAEKSADPKARGWLGSLYNNLGWSLHDAGLFQEALSTFQKALDFREEQGKESPIRIAKWSVARCIRSLGRPAEALEMQRQLHQECASSNSPDGFVEEEIAECLLALGRAEEAKPHFAQAHELLKESLLDPSGQERLDRLLTLSA